MGAVDEAIEHARELLDGVGPISARKMFGGAGLYRDGVIFAVIVQGELMLKADPKTPAGQALIAEGRLLKLGRVLAVGDVLMTPEGSDKPVARASMTYSIPPEGSAAALMS